MLRSVAIALVALLSIMSRDAGAQSQIPWSPRPHAQVMELDGPRFGVTVLDDSTRALVSVRFDKDVTPAITQFGWQKEKRFMTTPTGFTGETEWVALVGGVDQGLFLPSFTWLVGARTAEGVEFAVGPNLGAGGFGLAAAAGVTFRAGALNIPLNFAAVRSPTGVRISLLAGFNLRRP